LKLTFSAVFIRLMLHSLLGTQQLLLEQRVNRLPLLKPLIEVWNHTILLRVNAKVVGMTAIQDLKW
jgi:hypothetical protein